MRKKIVAGNWKMNKTLAECKSWADEMLLKYTASKNVSVIVAPPTPYISMLSEVFKNKQTVIGLAAQNCHHEEKGAYTGEVAADMIRSVGADHVIIGHSERRTYFNENNKLLAKKITTALKNNLVPIYCVGEKLEERQSQKQFDVVRLQLMEALPVSISKIIIAYEPVWAIGTGHTASAEQAQEMHAYIRKIIGKKWGSDAASAISVIYGGSCNAQNAKELFSCKDVDGGLLGGASLSVDSFIQIINSFPG